jgi:hypothetical protein
MLDYLRHALSQVINVLRVDARNIYAAIGGHVNVVRFSQAANL